METLKTLAIKKKKKKVLMLGLPIPFLAFLLTFFVLKLNTSSVISLTALSGIISIAPYFWLMFDEFTEIKNVEKSYPNFLRDIAQSKAAGMTLSQAVDTSAKTNYGALTKYIKKLHIWLSWGIPFPEAWTRFSNALEKSMLIKRINRIVTEAFRSGGNLESTLDSLANNATVLKEMEAEKKSVTRQQTSVIYVIYFIFLGIIVALFKILVPILFIQKLGIFAGISVQAEGSQLDIDYFKTLFFIMTIVQSFSTGIIAGQISEGNLIGGFKHILLMLGVGIVLFFLFIFPTSLSIDAAAYPSTVGLGGEVVVSGDVFFEAAAASGARVDIIPPEGGIVSQFTDDFGGFEKTITMPLQPGRYKIVVSATLNGEERSVTEYVTVESQ